MDTSAVLSLTGTFLQVVGELLADLKRRELADIDIELLNLKRSHLAEALERFKLDVQNQVAQEKAKTEQDLVSRGLANTTVRQSALMAIEQDASNEIAKATQEYNRAIEEISLLERKIKEQVRPWWRRLLRSCGMRRV